MKILVCGSEGRIMAAAIPRWLSDGHEVIGIDNGQKWGVHDIGRPYRLVWGDCSNPNLLQPLLRGIDVVIQAAATLYGVVGFHQHPADILRNDLALHKDVLDGSAKAGVSRVVYLSSSMVYEQCGKLPHAEEDTSDAPVPRTDYGLSKLVGERLSYAYFRQYGLPFTIWRPFNALDPKEEGRDEPGLSHVFADIMHRLVNKQQNPLEILGDGEQIRSFAHVKEIGEAIADFSLDPRALNATYNIGRDEPVSIKDLARRLHAGACEHGLIAHPRELEFTPRPVPVTDVRQRIGSFRKIDTELNWKSRISLDEMVDQCVLEYVGWSSLLRRDPSLTDSTSGMLS